jgi:hypothetical protein
MMPFFLQVLLVGVVVVLLFLTAGVFLTAQRRSDEAVERILNELDTRMERDHTRVVCLVTLVIEVPMAERTPELVNRCYPDGP